MLRIGNNVVGDYFLCIFLETRLVFMWAVGFCKFGAGKYFVVCRER